MSMKPAIRSSRLPVYAPEASAGFGLIELMIGVLIGTMLLLGITSVFSTTRNAYQTSEGLARTQEDSRFAMDFLERDLRMAGHQGCVNDVSHFKSTTPQLFSHFLTHAQRQANNWSAAPFGEQFDMAISGFEYANTQPTTGSVSIVGDTDPVQVGTAGNWTPNLPTELTATNGDANKGVMIGSDVVMVRGFDSNSMPVTAINVTVNPATLTVPVAYAGQVTANSLYGLADCQKASIFQASTSANAATGVFTVAGISGTPVGLNQSGFEAGENYSTKQLQLYPLKSVAYYIGYGTNGAPALRRMNFSAGCTTACQSEELVDGIENLQVMYGYDNHNATADGAIDQYWTAAQVTNTGPGSTGGVNTVDDAWRRIGSVRFAFISRSLDVAQANTNISPPTLSVLDTTVTVPSTDKRLRQVYVSTVALRNQLFGN